MKQLKILRNPYILFSPFLLIYIIYVIRFPNNIILDNDRYIQFAQNLLNGFYSPPHPDIDLWWGPGYPILLMPFVGLNLPHICITLMNAVFFFLSVILLNKTLNKFVSFELALGTTLFWACCFSMYNEITIGHTESLAALLIAWFSYSVINYFLSSSKKYLLYSAFALGYLALTKVLFGYVVLTSLVCFLVLQVLYFKNHKIRKATYILILALIVTMPYLIYTYNLTNRFFYWGNSGGMSLYWMSSVHENEYGDWNYETLQPITPKDDTPERLALLQKTHQKDMDEILKYTGVERDDAYKRMALNNIKSHPDKFIKNIISNASRLLFDFPYTYSFQRPLLKVFYFSIFFTLSVFSFIVTFLNWNKTEFSVRFLLIIGLIYIGGSLLLSMYNRMLLIMLPLFLFWIAYILSKSISIKNFK